jgi:hypothetical protein
MKRITMVAVLAVCGASVCHAEEPSAILEIGGASETSLKGGTGFGPSFAAEMTPIDDVLEIEAGISPLYSHDQMEWDAVFLFKKPDTLSDTVGFMAGIGPSWSQSLNGAKRPMHSAVMPTFSCLAGVIVRPIEERKRN